MSEPKQPPLDSGEVPPQDRLAQLRALQSACHGVAEHAGAALVFVDGSADPSIMHCLLTGGVDSGISAIGDGPARVGVFLADQQLHSVYWVLRPEEAEQIGKSLIQCAQWARSTDHEPGNA